MDCIQKFKSAVPICYKLFYLFSTYYCAFCYYDYFYWCRMWYLVMNRQRKRANMNVIPIYGTNSGLFGVVCDVYKQQYWETPRSACVSGVFFETVNNFTCNSLGN